MKNKIQYHSEDIKFSLSEKNKISTWIKTVILLENNKIDHINIIFCSDEYLLKKNIEYLNHDTYTDVITFDYSIEKGILLGDIFISIDRVINNSEKFKITFISELCTVIIHGVLHLLGYNDTTTEEKSIMRKMECKYTSLVSTHLQGF